MRSLFRSEPMARCQLFLQSEAAYQCIAELGELGRVQFSDLNGEVSAFQRKFVNDVRRCDEMQRLLTYVEKELLHEDLIKPDPEDVDVEIPLPKDMIDMEAMFQRMEEELRQVNDNVAEMTRNYVQLIELKHVLRSVDEFFETRLGGPDSPKISPRASKDISTMDAGPSQYADTNTLHDAEAGPSSQEDGKPTRAAIKGAQEEEENLNFVAGTIPVSRFQAFERLLWRVGRGIIFCHQVFIDETLTDIDGKPVRKSVFIVFFPGEQLKQRVKKICDAFHANVYPCPPSADERREAAIGVLQRIEDMKHVFNGSRDHRMKVLANAAKNIRAWKVQLCKMKAIFHIMNMLNVDVTQKCLIGECWIPENDMVRVQAALRRGTEAAGSSFPCIINHIETKESPPTFYKTNKFTNGFQQIVNAYGIGTYGELNPAPYAIITFPFLFAVMFGDAGHGVLMTCAALALIYFEKSLSKVREEIVATFFGGRYIVLFMGIFSIYTGLLYNDIFSKSMNVFGTTWTLRWESPTVAPLKNLSITISPDDFQRRPYPFGVDPIWMLTTNKIQFTNSYKMKMAIVLGFLQMCFGTFLSLSNSLHFKDRTNFPPPRTAMERFLRRTLNIWAQFIPEIMFLGSLFGYLVFMIIFKWVLPNGNPDNDSTYCARSLLMLFINLFMPSSDDPDKVMCYIKPLYPGAPVVEKIILIIALLAVPWLLLAKPLYLFYLNKVHSQPLPPDFVPIVAEEEVHETTDDNASSSSTSSRRKKSTVSMHTLKANNGLHTVDLDEPNVHETIVEEGGEEVEPFELGEVVIHQIIHTIEYCLGAVSNTASYLRLWALSLAHAQLSEVLWSMLFGPTLFKDSGDNVFASVVYSLQIFGYWFPWAFLTIAILLVMEGLSAFLHALRLHWVEFMNKFFAGEGYLFTPFDFKEVIFSMDE